MLSNLIIEQFKCFKYQEVPFKGLTVLAGANGVGKSTVLQAILLLYQLYQKSSDGGEDLVLPVNNKIDTFLELGNGTEILYSSAIDSSIKFTAIDGSHISETAILKVDGDDILSIKGTVIKHSASDLPFKNYLHYLNAERIGPRNTQSINSQKGINVGYQGEYTGQAIAKATSGLFEIENLSRYEGVSSNFDRQVESWLEFVLPEIEIQVRPYFEINQVRIGIRKKGAGTPFLHPNNIGFGISYALPIIVSGLLAKKGDLLIVENPEAHLHPQSQSKIGQFLSRIANSGVQVIVETHSEHVINGLRLACLRDFITFDDLLVNFFQQEKAGEAAIQTITINNKGELTDWPQGFFDQDENDLRQIFKLSRSR